MTIIQHISPPCTIPWQLQCVCFRPNDGFACSIISQTRMISITANISDGQTWTLSSNHCSTCICEVHCAVPECPKLACVHQVTDPGACCPRCRGCVYAGEEHTEGSSWFADSTPCMTCMCVDGVTTCSEVHCLSPCVNFISVPGECCPMCADSEVSCLYQGTVFHSNEHWEVDECTSCTCLSGDVHCRSERCPPLTCANVSVIEKHTHKFFLMAFHDYLKCSHELTHQFAENQ
uniref:VWFC domain-containing protein n=1 Tax=Haplochromis burtoni TaxID=8153 RepID=A0A3Q2VZC6_HAPBU